MGVVAGLIGSGVVGAAVSVAVGIVVLYAGAEALVKGASGLTEAFGVSAALAGVTVIAFATTAPELAVVTLTALTGGETIGLGTIVGSNVANVGLVLGVSALIRPLEVSRDTVRYHLPFVALAAVLLVWFGIDGQLIPLEGVGLLLGLVVFTYVLFRSTRGSTADGDEPACDDATAADDGEEIATDGGDDRVATDDGETLTDEEIATDGGVETRRWPGLSADGAYVLGGLLALVFGARQLVSGGETLMLAVGITERLVGLTVVALGTSLPELAASVVAVVRGEDAFSVGNVVGSNVYNVLAVVGVMLLLTPTAVQPAMIRVDFPVLLAVTGVLAAALLGRGRIGRPTALVLLGGYLGYVVFLI